MKEKKEELDHMVKEANKIIADLESFANGLFWASIIFGTLGLIGLTILLTGLC